MKILISPHSHLTCYRFHHIHLVRLGISVQLGLAFPWRLIMHVLAIWVFSLVKYLFRFISPGCAVCVSFWVVGCSPEDSLQLPVIWTSLMTREVAGIFVVSPATLLSVKIEDACAFSPSSPDMVSSWQDSKAFWGTGRERRQHRLWCHWHLSFYLLRGKWFYTSVSTAAWIPKGFFSPMSWRLPAERKDNSQVHHRIQWKAKPILLCCVSTQIAH